VLTIFEGVAAGMDCSMGWRRLAILEEGKEIANGKCRKIELDEERTLVVEVKDRKGTSSLVEFGAIEEAR